MENQDNWLGATATELHVPEKKIIEKKLRVNFFLTFRRAPSNSERSRIHELVFQKVDISGLCL